MSGVDQPVPPAPAKASWATGSRRRGLRRLASGSARDVRWLGRELLRRRPRPEDEPRARPVLTSSTRPGVDRRESGHQPATTDPATTPTTTVGPAAPVVDAVRDGSLPAADHPGVTVGAPAQWARTRPVRAVRGVLQSAALKPFLHAELAIESFGSTSTPQHEPMLLVANHASHLDALVIAASLPAELRHRLAVAASADYFFKAWWRAIPSALLVNSLPLREGSDAVAEVRKLLDGGWTVLVFGEPSRSDDGSVHAFDPLIGTLALQVLAPIVPVGVRGTFSAMPRGRFTIRTGRPRVSVRFGSPLRPEPAESGTGFAERVTEAVRSLIAEDTHTWWQVLTGDAEPDAQLEPGPSAARWRRIWAQTDAMAKGGHDTGRRIWS